MKKKSVCIILSIILVTSIATGCGTRNTNNTKYENLPCACAPEVEVY